MFLKALSIKGFKSFAESTRLELEPGITVVVGPNGSGKSNVVDAIAWVLGAQAPTAVRSQKMDDVIFAGTASKAALGRAEVTLTIDNSDKLLPIEFTEVTITRILFRSGDSEYLINNVPCRLLDIQELLSDSGVGRQQHIIVSQGQIDAVLNARPEERRLIIEEAAGVLKYRRRKERAERRLNATEENLNRIQDLVREVRRQLRPLEKQADAARRYEGLITELNALRLHLAGRELAALRGRLEGTHRQRAELSRQESELKSTLARLDAEVLDSEAELAALGGSDVGDVLSRARSLRERLSGQTNVVGERRRRLEGELQSMVDEGVVANLEAEAARIADELLAARDEQDALGPEQVDLEASEAQLAADRVSFDDTWGEGLGPPPTQAAEVRAQVSALVSATERDQNEGRRLRDQLTKLAERADRFGVESDRARETITGLTETVPRLEAAVARAEAAETATAARVDELTERRRSADAEASRWQARADALAQALDAVRSEAGVDALAGTEGVLGTLLDLVAIDDGWETAVEAAVGEALRAVVVDSPASGRAALEALVAADVGGAVLALGRSRSEVTAPPVGRAVRSHVSALRSDVGPLLDGLVGSAVVVDGSWAEAVDAALAYPDAVIVTAAGDRFGPTGWRLGRAGTGATGAALEEARTEEAAAVEAAGAAATALEAARQEAKEAGVARRRNEEQLRSARQDLMAAERLIEQFTDQLEDLAGDRERLAAQQAEIGDRQETDRQRLVSLQVQLPGLEAEERTHRDRAQAMTAARESLEERSQIVGRLRNDLDVRRAAVAERLVGLETRQVQIEERLERLAREREQARRRRVELTSALDIVAGLAGDLEEKRSRVDEWLASLVAEQEVQSAAAREVSDGLSARRRERSQSERRLVEVSERRNKIDLDEAENRVRLETLTEAIRRDLETEPDAALGAPCPELPDGASPESRARELERELKKMGPINPLALEEFEELKERHEFLNSQLDDVKTTKRDLNRLIREIDEQIVSVFSSAYADVATNFTELFATLFPGGRGAVRLTDPNDLLNCGVEIEAKPSGKNVKKLSLLSGGERSLTALGFLFAVFRSRPSPFYVMDEVEAALDDINLNRFLNLIQEFRKEAQLLIVSHQKRTMEAADVLYGVSMKPGGSSKAVSEKVDPTRVTAAAGTTTD